MSGLAGVTQRGHACPGGLHPTHPSWPCGSFSSPEPSHPSQGPCSPCHRAYPRGSAHSPPRPVAPQRSHPLWKPYELEVGTRPKSEACQGAQQNPSPHPSAGPPSPGREAADGRGAGQCCPLRAPRLAPHVGGRLLGVGDPGSAPGLLAVRLQGGPKPALGGPWEGLWHATKSYQKLCCGGLHPTMGDHGTREAMKARGLEPVPSTLRPHPLPLPMLLLRQLGRGQSVHGTYTPPVHNAARATPRCPRPRQGAPCWTTGQHSRVPAARQHLQTDTHQSVHVPEQQLLTTGPGSGLALCGPPQSPARLRRHS